MFDFIKWNCSEKTENVTIDCESLAIVDTLVLDLMVAKLEMGKKYEYVPNFDVAMT